MAAEDLSVEQKAEQLARLAADRAAKLAVDDAAKAQEIAVARAIKDANIDRDLLEHGRHLAEINGSQKDMARSLTELKDAFDVMRVDNRTQAVAATKIADYIREQGASQFSKRTLWIAAVAALATWALIITTVLTNLF